MKKFLSKSRKSSSAEFTNEDTIHEEDPTKILPSRTNHSNESYDSIQDLSPMFGKQSTSQTNASQHQPLQQPSSLGFFDTSLNLNPSISNTNTHPISIQDKSSLFSSKQSFSTKQSSYQSNSQQKRHQYQFGFGGQSLQILKIDEEPQQQNKLKGNDTSSRDRILDELRKLSQNLEYIMSQYTNLTTNLSTTVVNSIECFKSFNAITSKNTQLDITSSTNLNLRKIIKIYLNFYDILLKDDVYIKLRLILVKHFNDFANKFNNNKRQELENLVLKPQNFAIGSGDTKNFPNVDVLRRIMDKMSQTNISINEQNGSFIAPIMRGVSHNLSVLCLYFGYPDPQDIHYKLTQTIHDLYEDIHVLVMKNRIELASSVSSQPHISNFPKSASSKTPSYSSSHQTIQKFKLPFRIPTDPYEPPMSISISTENSSKVSGTMGGYIYPKINLKKQPHLKSYANSKFAISCGHVCLDSTNPTNYPNIAAPSPSLISLYKEALLTQFQRSNQNSEGSVAYKAILTQMEQMFPLKKVKISTQNGEEHYELKNLPKLRFGQIIWGERTLINLSPKPNEISGIIEKKLSDLAIIKVNKAMKCNSNYLGDDVQFNEYDPSLIMENLYVRKVLNLNRFEPKPIDENIQEVDSQISAGSDPSNDTSYHGLSVFKYGSTTRYTRGNLNGIKLVYWLDGSMHSSEFIVNSIEFNSSFASGGDSGSWILTKLQDIDSNSQGLGVLGMLHSYDGDYKQFGLFTPMCEILARLEEVTNIKWGVVGCVDGKGYDDDNDDGENENENEVDSEDID
ncbi:SSY5 [Candida pseudojiufengensis]|uniref:SSY5 n=1 Tax=Candida pseudojiufengensis TaxID=497109 RepID=UPI002224142C|nr:SSY5 [Candida pseudojiufengensis]KAI5962608.1 SSY5 [Candida pseudojiufengensis]